MTPAVLIAVLLVNTAMAIERWHEDRGDIWVTQTGKSQPVNRTADHPEASNRAVCRTEDESSTP